MTEHRCPFKEDGCGDEGTGWCKSCPRRPVVPLTEADVRRIAEQFHMKPRVEQLTESDVRRIVAEMLSQQKGDAIANAHYRIREMRRALREIYEYRSSDRHSLGDAIETARKQLQADDKLARGEA